MPMELTKLGTLSLDQLRVLVTVVDAGSFSAAARALGRAQSAISQAVATLEELQGVVLFDRAGYRPQLTDVGRVLADQARLVLESAARFEAVAANSRKGLEPELAIAIDPLVPTEPLIEGLRALGAKYPQISLRFSTEGLGGSVRRLRDGTAALALCVLLPAIPADVVAVPLLRIKLRAVVASGHPLARLRRAATRADLERHVQLVLSDAGPEPSESYGILSGRVWRFVDLGRRLDFLLAGFGWCRMPEHLVAAQLASGALVPLRIADDPSPREALTIHAAHRRDTILGPAARWLLDAFQETPQSLGGTRTSTRTRT